MKMPNSLMGEPLHLRRSGYETNTCRRLYLNWNLMILQEGVFFAMEQLANEAPAAPQPAPEKKNKRSSSRLKVKLQRMPDSCAKCRVR